MFEHLLDAFLGLGDVAFVQKSVEIVVETTQAGGKFTPFGHVQRLVHLVDDGLGALHIVVDRLVELLGVVLGEPQARLLEKSKNAVVEQQDQLSRRGSLGRHLAVGLPGPGGWGHSGGSGRVAFGVHLDGQ